MITENVQSTYFIIFETECLCVTRMPIFFVFQPSCHIQLQLLLIALVFIHLLEVKNYKWNAVTDTDIQVLSIPFSRGKVHTSPYHNRRKNSHRHQHTTKSHGSNATQLHSFTHSQEMAEEE
jgi:hypothetical protein